MTPAEICAQGVEDARQVVRARGARRAAMGIPTARLVDLARTLEALDHIACLAAELIEETIDPAVDFVSVVTVGDDEYLTNAQGHMMPVALAQPAEEAAARLAEALATLGYVNLKSQEIRNGKGQE
ncbi:hypothetical protein V5G24_00090 [Xanthobacter sp. VTT E-85241]|uniref:hypothetical protein n=1 Tax=Roseixanthobacter finlandensis TaxID=3119922 RepID=UPI00372885B9